MKSINIMTACDEGYAKYILPQLVSIHKNIGEYKVNFFLLYNRITPETIDLLKTFCDKLENIEFFPCYIDKNIEKYNLLASSGGGGGTGNKVFPYEVYFLLECQNYLPEWVDRALYIHSADVVFVGDISDFYFANFNGKSLNVELSSKRLVKNDKGGQPIFYSSEERAEYIQTKKVDSAYFNSGTFMINVEKFREKKHSIDYFLKIRDEFISNLPEIKNGKYYEGDQTFFSVAFLGDVNVFHQPINHESLNFRQHNYSPVVKHWRAKLKKSEIKNPKIIHYDGRFKPWSIEPNFFKTGMPANVNEGNFLKGLHSFGPVAFQGFYQLYWEFVKETPLYDEFLNEAILLSKWTKRTYAVAVSSDINQRAKVLKLEREIENYKELLRRINDEVTNVEK